MTDRDDFVTIVIPRLVLRIPFKRIYEDGSPPTLTVTERRVFALLTTNLVHKEIASALNISVRAAKLHASSIYRKTKTKDRLGFLQRYGKPSQPEAPA